MARKVAFCLACKASKTRCEIDVTRPGVSCSRCQRLSKQCVLEAELPSIASATTFPTESTVGPILDFPHDSSALRVPLEAQQGWETPRESRSERDRKRQAEAASSFSALTNQSTLRPLPSVEDRWLHGRISSLISREAAQQAFYHFVDSFTPKFPVVIFPSGTNVHDLMEKKPIVFLSILSVASAGYCSVEAHKALVLESKRALAGRAIVQGEKSLELVQALQIASLWYRSPGDFKQVNFDQLASIMLTMAAELELECADVSRSVQNEEVWEHAEIQRACLSCFIISESISLILRRPKVIVWSKNMDVCLTDLEKNKVSASDAFLCELVRTELSCHLVDQQLFLSRRHRSAPTHGIVTAGNLQSNIDNSEIRIFNQPQQALIEFGRFASSLYALEPAMHVKHNVDEFAAPFSSRSLQTCNFMHRQFSTAEHLQLREIITASSGMLNSFLGLSVADILTLPSYIYGGRVIYSLIILCKLFKAIGTSTIDTSKSLLLDNIHLDEYLDRLVAIAQDLLARDEHNALSRSLLVVGELRKWYYKSKREMSHNTVPNEPSLSQEYSEPIGSCMEISSHQILETREPNGKTESIVATQQTFDDFEIPLFGAESSHNWSFDDLVNVDMFNFM
ncbi:Ff.00g115350.m01.CDS01 [Fusarium sp. VM40]|nr:Ff.00g115350.m01.CDS01 [Fusarium sp. VM40]